MLYQEFQNNLNRDEISKELFNTEYENLNPRTQADLEHRIAEVWINYKLANQ